MEVLRTATSGHLALSQGALPLVVPVTYCLHGRQLLVRARLGLLGAPARQPWVVALLVSQARAASRSEVLVHGRTEPASFQESNLAPPLELVPDEATIVLAVTLEMVKGQEYSAPDEPSRPESPVALATPNSATGGHRE